MLSGWCRYVLEPLQVANASQRGAHQAIRYFMIELDHICIDEATTADMPFIEACIQRFRLDDDHLEARQFLVLRAGEQIVAFGRIKLYREVQELSCVGVIEELRGLGLGLKIIVEIIRRFPSQDVYITTDLTEYFERLGFRRVDTPPSELREKMVRVEGRLRAGIVCMVLNRDDFLRAKTDKVSAS
jgi:N-acetylglutamate synthase-like GNAT family acetyltransferase